MKPKNCDCLGLFLKIKVERKTNPRGVAIKYLRFFWVLFHFLAMGALVV